MGIFMLEIGGQRFNYGSLEQLAAYCSDMARYSHVHSKQVDLTSQYHVGRASAFEDLALILHTVRVAGKPVHEAYTSLADVSRKLDADLLEARADIAKRDTRIAELEAILMDENRR